MITKENPPAERPALRHLGYAEPHHPQNPNPKANNRKKARKRMAFPYSVSFYIKMPRSLTGAFCISQW